MFKQAQDTGGLQNVEDMTDEQYAQALAAVHDHLARNAPQRHAWKLVHDQGPEDVTERDTPKAFYSGEPVRYKNYSYRLLCFFVTKLQPGATPMTCTEAVFEDALRQTNTRCHAFLRGLPSAAHYQGPQCIFAASACGKSNVRSMPDAFRSTHATVIQRQELSGLAMLCGRLREVASCGFCDL